MQKKAKIQAFLFLSVGILFQIAIIIVFDLLWSKVVVYNYELYLFYAMMIILVSISVLLIVHGIILTWASRGNEGVDVKLARVPSKFYKWMGVIFLGLIVPVAFFGISFLLGNYSHLNDDMGLALSLFISIVLIGCNFYYGWIGYASIGMSRKSVSSRKSNILKYYSIRKVQKIGALLLIATAGVPSLLSFILFPQCNYYYHTGFSAPAYDVPTGAHYNTKLDDQVLVNQTILHSLEHGLRVITRLQKSGGFPMSAETDGSRFYADRGMDCPLLEGEFTIQGGTPLFGGLFLQMYEIEPNPIYLAVAKDAADALLAIQDDINGGFYYDGQRYADGTGVQPHDKNMRRSAVLDDNVMQSAMSFLLDVYSATNEGKYLTALEKGFECLSNIEKTGGGWPQRSNYPSYCYPSFVTLNDNALKDIIFLMFKANEIFPTDPHYLDAAKRACLFLKRVQGNGGAAYQTGWAQQYDDSNQPAWARAFEPAAICSSQTVSAMECLLELYLVTGNKSWLDPIPKAIEWLELPNTTISWVENSQTVSGYARLYELGTNRPIYGLEFGKGRNLPYVYDYSQARGGYSWRGFYGVGAFINRYNELVTRGYDISSFRAYEESFNTLGSALATAKIKYQQQSESAFWLHNGYIHSSSCSAATEAMMKYIALATA